MNKISIITTRQNFVWKSMQEVFPAIEKCWKLSCPDSRIINVDREPLREHIHYLMKSDVLIFIAFNETIARFIIHMRKSLQLEIPMVMHLYGYATVGAWPLKRFGALDCFTESDLFIGTCQGDIKSMKLCFENARVHKIPYPYVPYEFEQNIKDEKEDELSFAYVGRISDQKNIEIILDAYIMLKNKLQSIPKLYIYGDEDFLGWPNFGVDASDCLARIVKKITHANLQDHVQLLGYQDRSFIYKKLKSKHVFLSASTHSDENFGMAAMRSLALGGRAVLSAWGGHFNFKIHHPNEVQLVRVHLDSGKPFLHSSDFAREMEYFLNKTDMRVDKSLAKYFYESSVVDEFCKLHRDRPKYNQAPLVPTLLGKKIFQQQLHYESSGFKQKAFSGYDDVIFQALTEAYRDEFPD